MIDKYRYQKILKSAFGSHYNESSDEWTDDIETRSIPSLIQGFLKLSNENLKILDLGCGAGKDVEYFACLGNSVMGLDLYPHNNWECIKSIHNRVNFICEDFIKMNLKFKFDLILDNGCFHHQHPENYILYLQKINSLLKVNKYYVLSTFKSNENAINVDQKGRFHKYFSDIELRNLLINAEFEIINQLDIYRIRKKEYYRLTFAQKAQYHRFYPSLADVQS